MVSRIWECLCVGGALDIDVCKDSFLTFVVILRSFNIHMRATQTHRHWHTHTRPDNKKQAAVFLGNPAMSFTLLAVHSTIMVSWKLLMKWHIFKWQLHFIIFPITASGVASSVTRKTQFHYTVAIWRVVSCFQMRLIWSLEPIVYLFISLFFGASHIYVLKRS